LSHGDSSIKIHKMAAILYLGGKNKILPTFSIFLYWVQMKFGTEGTHKYSLSDCEFHWNRYSENHMWSRGVHNFYTHFPHLSSDLNENWYKKYAQNAVHTWEFIQNRWMGSCNFPTGINEFIFTHFTKNMII